MTRNITVESLACSPIEEQAVEIVERKGLGHPDTICDSIMDSISVELSKEYLKRFNFIFHHNIDKSLLVAGRASHKFGGGEILEPMLIVVGDRATFKIDDEEVDVISIAEKTAKRWFKENLRFVDPEKHVEYQIELKEGSAELTDIFRRQGRKWQKSKKKFPILGANDTSACVGYAPLSKTERIVYETERFLNSKEFKRKFPEIGEDIKVMGIRNVNKIHLTIAAPLIEMFIKDEKDYFRKKDEIFEEIKKFVNENTDLKSYIYFNTLDKKGRGINGCYLSVTGTSAEDADCGQVGRGNRVNGVIPLHRPVSAEAAAGKNPVSHIGKIYNVLTHKIANKIYKEVDGVREAYVWLCSQIGKPIDQPKIAAAQLILKENVSLVDISKEVNEIIDRELEHITDLCKDLALGKEKIC